MQLRTKNKNRTHLCRYLNLNCVKYIQIIEFKTGTVYQYVNKLHR